MPVLSKQVERYTIEFAGDTPIYRSERGKWAKAVQDERQRVQETLNGLHNGTAPNRDERYQIAWRDGVAAALDSLTADLIREPS